MQNFGKERVLEPKGFFPVSAWRLDNRREISSNEMRVKCNRIKLEEENFRQLCNSCDYNIERIKKRIFNIMEKRGKLHNQLTDSGGICCGVVEAIGEEFQEKEIFKVGEKIIGIASLTAIPLHIEKIKSINFNYAQIEIEGYAIFFPVNPVVHMPEGIPEEMLLSAFDESGSLEKASKIAECGSRFLVLGSNLFTLLIYSAAIRFANGVGCHITACLDLEDSSPLEEKQIYKVLKPYVDSLHIMDMSSPIENYKMIIAKEFKGDPTKDELYDSSIVCSNLMGMESIGVLLTKNHGNLFFTNLINNYNLVLLCAESFGKNINAISLEEYTSGFPKFTESLLRDIRPKLEQIHRLYSNKDILNKFPRNDLMNIHLRNISKLEEYAYGSEQTKSMLEEVLNIASYDCNVLILGETGVGKERILDIIHKNSSRRGNPCVKINCSAITENLAESEFFGYERGAFTGAKDKGRKGFFELANTGILFLDEVADLPLGLQAKLLRVIQEGQFYRVGGEAPVNVNVRIICATNRDIKKMIRKNRFREDLYYRLNICELYIKPLRERTGDIKPLINMFLNKYNNKYMLEKRLALEAIDELESYGWPGNVRELENVIHKLVINTKDNNIDETAVIEMLHKQQLQKSDEEENAISERAVLTENDNLGKETLTEIMGCHERALIEDALKRYKVTRKAAEALGISQSQLMRKKKKYGL